METLFTTPPLSVASNVWLLQSWVDTEKLRLEIDQLQTLSPLRRMQVPSGSTMAVVMTNCGEWGWVSDAQGYRYSGHDPLTGKPWLAMPDAWMDLAGKAAEAVGWPNFEPDACLVNCYTAGAGMGLHQDKNEHDFSRPIVSVSIGASCRFAIGGLQRHDSVTSVELRDGDVVVWGGDARLVYHGVRPLKAGVRYNLTFRKAG